MFFKSVALRTVPLIETEDLNIMNVSAGKEVPTVRKLDFSARLDEDLLIYLQVSRTYVHASNLIGKPHNDLKASRVKSHGQRLIHVGLTYF